MAFGLASSYLVAFFLNLSEHFLALIKIIAEPLFPQIFTDLTRVSSSISGGWVLHTRIADLRDPLEALTIEVDRVFLSRAVMWIPACVTLIFVTSNYSLRRAMAGLLTASLVAAAFLTLCVAAHLAIVVNAAPSVFDDGMLPPPPDFPTSAKPYPVGYFWIVTFGFYLVQIVAPMAAPVIIWLCICRSDLIRLTGYIDHAD